MSNHLLAPICWIIGHVEVESEDKPGWFQTACGRCGYSTFSKFPPITWYEKGSRKAAELLVGLAQKLIHADDFNIGYNQIDNIDYISRKHLESIVSQDEPDGWGATISLKGYLNDEGLVRYDLTNTDPEEFVDMLNKSFEAESNKHERKKTMKIMKGELPREDL